MVRLRRVSVTSTGYSRQFLADTIAFFNCDGAGRGQYIYHEQWRKRRDRAKHDQVLDVALRLPTARGRVTHALNQAGMPRAKALALAFRLLDLAHFRAGSEVLNLLG